MKFFITHSWKDIEFARRLCNDLIQHGNEGFLDDKSLQGGQRLAEEINRGLEWCDVYIPILSRAALSSPWCWEEINAAINLSNQRGRGGRPRIISVLVEDCELPALLAARLYFKFENRYDAALSELLNKGLGLSVEPSVSAPKQSLPKWLAPVIVVALFVIVASIVIGAVANSVVNNQPTATLTRAVASAPSTIAPTVTLTNVPTLTPKPTDTVRPSVTPTPGIGSATISPIDGATMRYVPSGEFVIGSADEEVAAALKACTESCSRDGLKNEKPQHPVLLEAYWIDEFLVTNARYKKCVDAGKCAPPSSIRSATRSLYFGAPAFGNYPVIYVSWNDAKDYCDWSGKRLVTEAEWERAARGWDRRIFPWGNTFDSSKLNSLESKNGDTTEVGAYPAGASPYGVMDMAGNVWEWVADWYLDDYYTGSPRKNPTGPSAGRDRVLRGGTWGVALYLSRSAARNRIDPNANSNGIGFRCAKNATP